MRRSRRIALGWIGLAWMWLILSGSVVQAVQPDGGAAPGTPLVSDLELDAEGSLRGVVVNVQGVPVAGIPIVVRKVDQEVARTTTDALGCFSVPSLDGGVHQVATGRYARMFRTWIASTAPPETARFALLVVGGDVVRSQVPLGECFSSHAVVNKQPSRLPGK